MANAGDRSSAVRVAVLEPAEDLADQLVTASRNRCYLDCRTGDGRGSVDADRLRDALLKRRTEFDPFGIRLVGADMEAGLDLRGVAFPVPLYFVGCWFGEPVAIEGGDLHSLIIAVAQRVRLEGLGAHPSRLPGLLANGVRLRRDLILSGTDASGALWTTASETKTSAIWITEADVGGRLLCVGTKISAGGDRAIQADRTRFAGDVRLIDGFEADAELRLLATNLRGSLDLAGATLRPRDGRAIDLGEAEIGGSLFIIDYAPSGRRPRIEGRLEMGRATVHGRVLVRNAHLEAPASGRGRHGYNTAESAGRPLLLAPRVRVRPHV